MLDIIATTQNKKYKYIKSLKQKKARDENSVYTVEGRKSVCDAISADSDICLVAMSESYYGEYGAVQSDFVVVKDELFSGLCDTKTPQGIIAVIKKRDNVIKIKRTLLSSYIRNIIKSRMNKPSTIKNTVFSFFLSSLFISFSNIGCRIYKNNTPPIPNLMLGLKAILPWKLYL